MERLIESGFPRRKRKNMFTTTDTSSPVYERQHGSAGQKKYRSTADPKNDLMSCLYSLALLPGPLSEPRLNRVSAPCSAPAKLALTQQIGFCRLLEIYRHHLQRCAHLQTRKEEFVHVGVNA
ncbi:hypothetical protein EK904_004665 [Melospiza melodia maxima]|nr:hypothetical protein EK904_004665 [Melospiza melodia maxima]